MIRLFVISALSLLSAQDCADQKTTDNTTKISASNTVNTPSSESAGLKIQTNTVKETDVKKAQTDDTKNSSDTSASSAADNSSTTDPKGIVYLREGENRFLKEYQMNVTLINIHEDSRCPPKVQCVWAGAVVVNIELMSTTSRPVTVQLATVNMPTRSLKKSTEFNGYKISLVEVSPSSSDKGFRALKGSYRIGLKFEKADPFSTSSTTK